MSASSLRYQSVADRNGELRREIVRLAQRHRSYGAGMIYLKLRQAGHRVNHKRVDRLCDREPASAPTATEEDIALGATAAEAPVIGEYGVVH